MPHSQKESGARSLPGVPILRGVFSHSQVEWSWMHWMQIWTDQNSACLVCLHFAYLNTFYYSKTGLCVLLESEWKYSHCKWHSTLLFATKYNCDNRFVIIKHPSIQFLPFIPWRGLRLNLSQLLRARGKVHPGWVASLSQAGSHNHFPKPPISLGENKTPGSPLELNPGPSYCEATVLQYHHTTISKTSNI